MQLNNNEDSVFYVDLGKLGTLEQLRGRKIPQNVLSNEGSVGQSELMVQEVFSSKQNKKWMVVTQSFKASEMLELITEQIIQPLMIILVTKCLLTKAICSVKQAWEDCLFNYMYKVEDTTKWYNTSSWFSINQMAEVLRLSAISQFYLYGEGLASASNKRSLTPAGSNMDLGMSSAQWRDMFIQNAPTVSSDRNLKQDIEAISEAEKSVATALKGMVKKYRLKSSVEKKGDEARVHIGWIAQEVEDAFTAEGLRCI